MIQNRSNLTGKTYIQLTLNKQNSTTGTKSTKAAVFFRRRTLGFILTKHANSAGILKRGDGCGCSVEGGSKADKSQC